MPFSSSVWGCDEGRELLLLASSLRVQARFTFELQDKKKGES